MVMNTSSSYGNKEITMRTNRYLDTLYAKTGHQCENPARIGADGWISNPSGYPPFHLDCQCGDRLELCDSPEKVEDRSDC
ncbi:hypothetical protein AVEN_263305-1 [Araneus ventricosus]|uniref:Uncharacterized protein n=1 Tax=Araneus ventricosus TaxID=182803 RepID=A0A4Y2KGH5_ARAVE|nr:hypothetical protein AVEN_263305-1 [Araneus ventricosus]